MSGALIKTEQPSTLIDRKLNAMEDEVIEYLSNKLQISKEKASNLLESTDGTWERLIKTKKRQLDLQMIDLISGFREATYKKLETGSLEQARAGIMGIAIGSEKVFGESGKPTFQIGGKNVQVNLGWKFKPYKALSEK